ncbi:MAG: hypothetical protein LBI37_03450 [Puniceicoccales bacterium]|jgi:hypothetical protein|nr:hypothetical protein [Puniceicoccales bacterium]
MDNSQREFLMVLAYLYLQYSKYDEAFLLLRGLREFFHDDINLRLSYVNACLATQRPKDAFAELEDLDGIELNNQQKKLFYLLRSKVMWGLGHDSEARSALVHFLGMEEREARMAEATRKNSRKK